MLLTVAEKGNDCGVVSEAGAVSLKLLPAFPPAGPHSTISRGLRGVGRAAAGSMRQAVSEAWRIWNASSRLAPTGWVHPVPSKYSTTRLPAQNIEARRPGTVFLRRRDVFYGVFFYRE
jgi:hypothetical protein